MTSLHRIILYSLLDNKITEFSRTGDLILRYYFKYARVKGLAESVTRFSLVILDDPNLNMLVYGVEQSNTLSHFHTSVLKASMGRQVKADI